MATKLSAVLNKVSMTQIPENALLHGVVKELEGRECFKDTDEDLGERIYTGDVFQAIASEIEQMGESVMRPTDKVIAQIDELAELIDTEYVQIINN